MGNCIDYVVTNYLLKMFVIAFQMAVPVVGSLFLSRCGLGIIARTVPQVNVFVVGLPLKIIVGFFVISCHYAMFIS